MKKTKLKFDIKRVIGWCEIIIGFSVPSFEFIINRYFDESQRVKPFTALKRGKLFI